MLKILNLKYLTPLYYPFGAVVLSEFVVDLNIKSPVVSYVAVAVVLLIERPVFVNVILEVKLLVLQVCPVFAVIV
jgi:hypothetical protein